MLASLSLVLWIRIQPREIFFLTHRLIATYSRTDVNSLISVVRWLVVISAPAISQNVHFLDTDSIVFHYTYKTSPAISGAF